MRKFLTFGALILIAGCASGCANANIAPTIKALGDAGCKGQITAHIEGATAAGASPGAANGKLDFVGSCDPADRPMTPVTTTPAT